MATGKSGVIQHTLYNDYYIAKHGYSYVDVYWEEEYDVAANTSVIKVTKITFSHSKYGGTWSVYGTVTVDGTAYSFSSSMTSGGAITNPITSNAIYHDDATGAKTITISTAVNTVGGSGGTQFYSGNHGTASVSVALTTIPRLSELSARGGTLGTAQTLSVTQKSSSYTHTITYVCGSTSGTICTKSSGLSISWTPPISLASQNTTGTSVSITLTITTYSGDTAIGSKETGITCTIPTSVCLKVSDGWATVSPYNTGSAAAAIDAYVQGYSKAAVVFDDSKISTDDAYGATIQSYRITCGGKQYTSPYQTDVLGSAGAVTVTVTVIDSRGYGVNEDFTVNVAAYANPVLSGISVFRCNSSGVAADDGTYLSVTAKANISSVEGLNTCTMELAIGSLMTVSVPDSETIIVGDGLVLSTSTYSVSLTLTDSLGNRAVYTQKIPTAEVFFHGRTGGSGAAFGKYAEADDLLDVNWDIRGRQDMQIDGALTVGERASTLRNLVCVGTPNGDFNALTELGCYWMQLADCTNGPSTSGYGFLEVINTHATAESGVLQRFTFYDSKRSVVRSYINSAWNGWSDPSYPVGSIYMSASSTSPASLFGGTWTKIEGRFLFAANNNYANGATGGATTHTLTVDQIPSHRHTDSYWYNTPMTLNSTSTSNTSAYIDVGWGNRVLENGAWRTGYTGGGGSHNNMPPYLVVYMWKRTA